MLVEVLGILFLKLRPRVAQQLCRRGILKHSADKALWISTRKIYPEIDPRPEAQLAEDLRVAIYAEDQKVPPRTAIELSLAYATGTVKLTSIASSCIEQQLSETKT